MQSCRSFYWDLSGVTGVTGRDGSKCTSEFRGWTEQLILFVLRCFDASVCVLKRAYARRDAVFPQSVQFGSLRHNVFILYIWPQHEGFNIKILWKAFICTVVAECLLCAFHQQKFTSVVIQMELRTAYMVPVQ